MSRQVNEINAGSMADIAFLLLIFFLVTTTMDMDRGISRILPPVPKVPPPIINDRNILKVLINKNDKLMVEGGNIDLSKLKEKVINFLLNPSEYPNQSEKKVINIPGFGSIKVSKGIISLKNDRGTSYAAYVSVQDELAKAYTELRNTFSQNHFGISYEDLTDQEKIKVVQKAIPLAISEAEPENTGQN
ncbi:MAG: biopolymer transporter ExbD [Bacteroidales bacterium]|nr:biopolymer transporter ExbD [Bacteroidales bacterium]MCF8403771.1 biopolymer transporter ExbD [Bacteroidales bacterium]